MALPKLNTVEYFCKLPVSGIEAKYRPFTVGEQKALLQALEEDKVKTITHTVINLVEACCGLPDSTMTVRELSNTDLEYLFLQVRIKSVGETSNIVLGCNSECDGQTPVEIDLLSVGVEGEVKSDIVKLTDEVSIRLSVPNFSEVQGMIQDIDNITTSNIFDVLEMSVREIITTDDVIKRNDVTSKELSVFLNEMSTEQFTHMMEWFNDLPKLVKEVEYNCVKCNTENKVRLEGIQNFFV